MHHWYREHFSTHQFYAHVLYDFAQTFPDDEIDLLESGRDRHGYDCVLIRSGEGQPLTRYVQLKSTENGDADLLGIHGSMLLSEFREIVQIWVSAQGDCEYYFLSDFGRIAHLSLAISGRQLADKSPTKESRVIESLKPLGELIGGFSPPVSYREIQRIWSQLKAGDWPIWDGQLVKARGRLWCDVLRPLAAQFKAVFPDWRRDRHTIDARWTRK
ncbi:MAG TPA: hypothetical protein VG734_27085, partial [Lacunisphaera sp.]|nr:hypothetical protein [Lacunisphaera sp.]